MKEIKEKSIQDSEINQAGSNNRTRMEIYKMT